MLAGVQPTDVVDPLSLFQQTRADRADMFKRLKDLNELLPADWRLEADRLTRAFDSFWAPFEKKFNEAIASTGSKGGASPVRDTQDMVSELLELVRDMKREDTAAAERTVQELQQRLGQVTQERHHLQAIVENGQVRQHALEQELGAVKAQLKKIQNQDLR